MKCGRLISLFVALAGLSIFAPAANAFSQNDADADAAVERFLSSQKAEREDAQAQDSAIADLDGDGKSEVVLVWTLLGPTYSHNTLTVFTRTAGGYKPAASLQLTGEAKLSSVKRGVILIEQMVLGKNDPRCCPSIKKRVKYRWRGRRISAVKG